MSDNELCFYVIALMSFMFCVLTFFLWKIGLLDARGLFAKAKYARKIYKQATTADEKAFAVGLSVFVLSRSTIKVLLTAFGGFSALCIAAACHFEPLKAFLDFLRDFMSLVRDALGTEKPRPENSLIHKI